MTSRQAHDDTRAHDDDTRRGPACPVAGSAGTQDGDVHSTAIPESADLPPRLDRALHELVDPTGPAVTFTVQPEPESVTDARHFAVCRLDRWGVPDLGDDVGLVVSELVTNALRHSGGPGMPDGVPVPNRDDPLRSAPSAIRLRLIHEAPWLLCGIIDASPAAPRRKEPDYIAETGRGLHLVDSFCIRWGWRGLATGKVVWALFRSSRPAYPS